jgi:hypothetical protein
MAINQLPAARYIPAKQAAHLVHPRPDTETASWAKHRKHYPGIKYEVPVGVSFGSWPFYYDLTTAPAGATIGENVVEVGGRLVPGDDYGVVTWDNPTVGSHTFQVTVSFQDGATPLVIDWTLEVTTAGTIFVDAVSGLDTNDGVLVADGGTGPLKTIDGWFKADYTDRTYTGYQVCYLAGTYVVGTSDPATTGNMRMNYLNKPLVHYAKNVEAVTWDFQNTMLMGFTSPQPGTGVNAGEYNFHDWFLGRITCSGGPTGDNKRRWYVIGDAESSFPYDGTEGACRNTWFKSPQIDWTSTGAVSNNAGICFGENTGSGTPARVYFYVTQCPITNITSTQGDTTNFNGWYVGQALYFLAEHNVITNTNFGRNPFGAKSSMLYGCLRNIDMSSAPEQPCGVIVSGSYAPNYGGGTEVSYCKVNYTDSDTVFTAVDWNLESTAYDAGKTYHLENYQFRNSASKAPAANGEAFRSRGNWATEVTKDIWCSKGDGIYGGAPSNTQLDGDWQLYALADDPFDSSMNLTNTEFAGTHGAEVLLESALATASISTSGNLVVEFSEVVSDGGGGIDDFTIAGRTLSNFVLDASGNTITADVSPVIEAADADPAVFYTQPTGGLQTVGAVDVASFNVSATNNSTQDNTAPVLSSTTGTTTGTTTATGTVDTDEGGGDIYWLADTSASTNQATVLSTGATQAVSSTGTKIVNAVGLAASTGYYFHFVHKDAAGNDSAVVHSPLFTTDSSAAPTLVNAAINSSGSNLALTFSEAVQEAGSEAAVTLSNGVTLAAPSGSGTNTLTFGLTPYVQAGETLTVSFAGGANVIEQNGGGVDTEAFAGFAVTNISTATPPAITGTPSINSTGTLLTFFFDDLLNNQTTPIHAPFSLVGGAYTFTSSSLPGTGASFVISPAVQQGDVLTLSFVGTANTFNGWTTALPVESFSGVAITNNSTVVTVPPVFTLAPVVSKTTLTGHTIRQTIDKAGTVYGVMLASEENPPSPEQIKAGTDGQNAAPVSATSVAATAGNPCVLTFSGGAKNTAYYYYIIAEDSVPNIQASPVKVTATTENLLFNGSGGGGLPAAGPKKKVKMKWEESKRKGKK